MYDTNVIGNNIFPYMSVIKVDSSVVDGWENASVFQYDLRIVA